MKKTQNILKIMLVLLVIIIGMSRVYGVSNQQNVYEVPPYNPSNQNENNTGDLNNLGRLNPEDVIPYSGAAVEQNTQNQAQQTKPVQAQTQTALTETEAKSSVNNNTNTSDGMISEHTKSQLIEIGTTELKTIEDYQAQYGNKAFGVVAYVLDKIRIFSIPLVILGIAVSAIYQYIIGIRHLEYRQKGYNAMIALVIMLVICQLMPLVFAIAVKGWRN